MTGLFRQLNLYIRSGVLMNSVRQKFVSLRREPPVVSIPLGKRALDISLILLASPILLPLMLFVALLIRFVSAGPVLFKQERVGYRGTRFQCFKFRTMEVGSDTGVHQNYLSELMQSNTPMTKMDSKGDARIICFGRWLRSTGLDELPQIFNILRGEMSLVGPRPCLPYEYAHYLPWQKERFNAAPGLTGLWQVSGKNQTTFSQMIQMDIDYSRRQGLSMDLQIIGRTVPALIGQVWDTQIRKKSQAPAAPEKSPLPIWTLTQ
jgi:exopolysaccharide production protein ExoY